MKRLFKSVVATTATAAMVASMGASAFANAEKVIANAELPEERPIQVETLKDGKEVEGVYLESVLGNLEFVSYDTTDYLHPHKVYNELANGKYTGKQVLIPVAEEDIEWKFEAYETAYPHAGYDRLYLEGNAQDIVRYNNLFPQWDVRRSDYEWEVVRPHTVWERRQTKINNIDWTWDFGMEYPLGNAKFQVPDATLKTKTSREALNPEYTYENYGFGAYNNAGLPLEADEVAMYKAFVTGEENNQKSIATLAIDKWNAALADKLSWDSLSERDAKHNTYVVSDKDIQKEIPVVKSEFISAQLNHLMDADTKDVAALYLENGSAWAWDYDKSFKVAYDAEIAWTAPDYQKTEPYYMYQYLIINGVVCDGEFVEVELEDGTTKLVQKPYVGRYTGGIADPKVEWKFYMYELVKTVNDLGEEEVLYQIVEQKFLDGEAVIIDDEPVLRRPTGRYGKTYFKNFHERVEYRVCDTFAGNNDFLLSAEDTIYKYEGNIGGKDIITNYGAGPSLIKVDVAAETHPQEIVNELKEDALAAAAASKAADEAAAEAEAIAKAAREEANAMAEIAAEEQAIFEAYKAFLAEVPATYVDFETYKAAYLEGNLDAFVAAYLAE